MSGSLATRLLINNSLKVRLNRVHVTTQKEIGHRTSASRARDSGGAARRKTEFGGYARQLVLLPTSVCTPRLQDAFSASGGTVWSHSPEPGRVRSAVRV